MALRGTIDDFKASVVNDFARPNLFQVDLNFPATLGISSDISTFGNFTVRAANLPASQIGVVEVPFRGRVLKIAGDRTFEPWTITIMNDSQFSMRNAFEIWANSIQAANENFTAAGTLGDATDSAIDLDFGNNDAIEEFTVELQVQYWAPQTEVSTGD